MGLGTHFGPKIDPKSTKNQQKAVFFSVTFFAMRFLFVFLRFLLNFRGLRTSKIVLPCTREHDFRKIAVFAPGSPFGAISAEKTSVFCPFGSPFCTPQIEEAPKNAPGMLSESSRCTFSRFSLLLAAPGTLRGRFWSLRGRFWSLRALILVPFSGKCTEIPLHVA